MSFRTKQNISRLKAINSKAFEDTQFDDDYNNHPMIQCMNAHIDMLSEPDYLCQMVLTQKYARKDLIEITTALRKTNRDVSIYFYGQNAFKNHPEINAIKWSAVVEANTDDQRYHVHLLINKPVMKYVKDEFKDVDAETICRKITEYWQKHCKYGGKKGEMKPIENEVHQKNLIHYLFKQYEISADKILYEHYRKY